MNTHDLQFDIATIPMRVPRAQIPALISALAAKLLEPEPRSIAALLPADDGPMLTAEQVAERLSCSLKWVYRRAKTLPFARRIGSSLRFSEQGLQKWIARQRLDAPC